MNCVRDFAWQYEQDTGTVLMFVPGREPWQFCPMELSHYLNSRIPGLSIGAANNYIWTAAFARNEGTMVRALRHLVDLLPSGFVRDTPMGEEAR